MQQILVSCFNPLPLLHPSGGTLYRICSTGRGNIHFGSSFVKFLIVNLIFIRDHYINCTVTKSLLCPTLILKMCVQPDRNQLFVFPVKIDPD